ncbi:MULTISPECIES: hypothetical protein [Streptomyces]
MTTQTEEATGGYEHPCEGWCQCRCGNHDCGCGCPDYAIEDNEFDEDE